MRPLALLPLLLLLACAADAPGDTAASPVHPAAAGAPTVAVPGAFGDYWYQGQAELTSYDLEQARYGEVHPGEAVLIFVTEPFSRGRQVKLDRPGSAGADEITVLKLNATRSFVTGIYPYAMMTSVFTPIGEGPMPLKVTTSAQEWCGHTFTQLNRTAEGWRARLFSYFEGESDQDRALPDVMVEDGLWTLLRLDPGALPTGELQLLPGGVYQRLSHRDLQPYRATATLSAPGDDGLRVYTITYPDLERTLRIAFQAAFPYAIEGWEEERPDGFGDAAHVLTTRATRRERIMLDYWAHNGRADTGLRADLGLDPD
jgi:hypothetical protein